VATVSKGSNQRPPAVDRDTVGGNWDCIFGPRNKGGFRWPVSQKGAEDYAAWLEEEVRRQEAEGVE
jgi:hypothetical protein